MRDNRTVFVKSLRLTPAERHCIDVVSQRQNLTLVEAARALIRLGAQSMGIWPEQSVPSPADKLLDGGKRDGGELCPCTVVSHSHVEHVDGCGNAKDRSLRFPKRTHIQTTSARGD